MSTWKFRRFLNVTSATKRCGKSLLFEVITELVYRPMPLSGGVSPAALFRMIEKCSPTLLLDEADTYFTEATELRGVVNGSHRRNLAYALRCVGEDHEARRFTTWCPKAISGIGNLPDTVIDRCVASSPRAAASGFDTPPLERTRQGRHRATATTNHSLGRRRNGDDLEGMPQNQLSGWSP